MSAAEEWRPVPGWPSYSVSNAGRVMSEKSGKPRLLKPIPRPKGYLRVGFYRGGRSTHTIIDVHRLVAEVFIGPCPDGQQVRHLDGNNQNNRASNLAYGTPAENIRDQVRHGTHREARKTHCPSNHPYDSENTHYRPNGHRSCRACHRRRQALRYAAQMAERRAA